MRSRTLQFVAIIMIAPVIMAACEPEPVVDSSEPQALTGLLSGPVADGFARANAPREFRFPDDHGPHPEFRNEWWYLTGNLQAGDGRRFGYQFTLFRHALDPAPVPADASLWRSRDIWMGHLALTDIDGEQFRFDERFARGAAGLAGAHTAPVRVWLHDWNLRQRSGQGRSGVWLLQAGSDEFELELVLEPRKGVVLQGDAGLSQKSSAAGNASYYSSLPRLATSGLLRLGSGEFAVQGESWLDREWSSSALGADQKGWDWFALQLDDGSELMYYQLRLEDGSRDPHSAGTLIAANGEVTRLGADDIRIAALGSWDSPLGGRYPQGWSLSVPGQSLELRVQAALPDQEMATFVRYWEGAVTVTGVRGTEPVRGRGYVELTGYARTTAAQNPEGAP